MGNPAATLAAHVLLGGGHLQLLPVTPAPRRKQDLLLPVFLIPSMRAEPSSRHAHRILL